jgi:hypothetical protein
VKPVVVTVSATETCWLPESVNVALHVPAALGVNVKVADGPLPDEGATVAIPVQLSLSPNAPVYPVSWTSTLCAEAAPVPFSESAVGFTLRTPGAGAVGVGDGVGDGDGDGDADGDGETDADDDDEGDGDGDGDDDGESDELGVGLGS